MVLITQLEVPHSEKTFRLDIRIGKKRSDRKKEEGTKVILIDEGLKEVDDIELSQEAHGLTIATHNWNTMKVAEIHLNFIKSIRNL